MDWLRLMVTQLALVLADWAAAAKHDSGKCLDLGFNSAKLLCSSCDDLRQFDLGSLASDCMACCTDDGGSAKLENTKYEKAILEVQAFIKSDRPARYPGLTIKYVRGADPVIKLLDEDEDIAETLAIDRWNTDSVEEFLDTVMVRQDPDISENLV